MRLVLAGSPEMPGSSSPGGVELREMALLNVASSYFASVHHLSLEDVPDWLERQQTTDTVLVLTHQEGRLSAHYRDWAMRCLDANAVILEMNIFALPSRYRLTHPRYITGLMSKDGVSRFILRTRLAGFGLPRTNTVLPNPVLLTDPPRQSIHGGDGIYRMLRVGRPTLTKWSMWEVRMAEKLASAAPDQHFELTLIGAPREIVSRAVSSLNNLSIACRPYTAQADIPYLSTDLYLHYCPIGETYGNTLAEALMSGCSVAYAVNPAWDSAPLDYLQTGKSIVGTRGWLLRHAYRVLALPRDRVLDGTQRATLTTIEDYGRRLQEIAAGEALQTTAPLNEAVRTLRDSQREVRGLACGARAVSAEVARGLRYRWFGN